MKIAFNCALIGSLVLVTSAWAQTTSAPAPSAGLLNDWLRRENSAFAKWDLVGSARGRYEVKDGYGIPGVPGSLDFRNDGVDVRNEYWTERLRYRVGYHDTWWSALVEGRSSFAQSDQRWGYFSSPAPAGTANRKGDGPESDTVDPHQASSPSGTPKSFRSRASGTAGLSYGDEAPFVGAFGWNNIGPRFSTPQAAPAIRCVRHDFLLRLGCGSRQRQPIQ